MASRNFPSSSLQDTKKEIEEEIKKETLQEYDNEPDFEEVNVFLQIQKDINNSYKTQLQTLELKWQQSEISYKSRIHL